MAEEREGGVREGREAMGRGGRRIGRAGQGRAVWREKQRGVEGVGVWVICLFRGLGFGERFLQIGRAHV